MIQVQSQSDIRWVSRYISNLFFNQVGDTPNQELRSLSSIFSQVIYRGKYLSCRVDLRKGKQITLSTGQSADLRHISLHALLPETDHYMTYEGSTTHPGCWETTSWIIFNKPIYITRQEVFIHTLYIYRRYRATLKRAALQPYHPSNFFSLFCLALFSNYDATRGRTHYSSFYCRHCRGWMIHQLGG